MAGKLGALVTLAIGRNAVRQLPGDLLSLPSLGIVLAGDNRIEAVPRQILQVGITPRCVSDLNLNRNSACMSRQHRR